MILIIYGDDGFQTQERVYVMRDAFVKKHDPSGINLSVFPTEGQTSVVSGEALQAACSLPFLAPKRMVIVRGVLTSLKKDGEKFWLEGTKRVPESTILIFWESAEPAAVEKTKLFTHIMSLPDAHAYPYPVLEGTKLTAWIKERAQTYGAVIEPAAIRELVDRAGADGWILDSELGKLAAYAQTPSGSRISPLAGGEPVITSDMVRELVRATFEGQIFALVDAVGKREPREALRLLEQERQSGADDHQLLSMLARQVRLLLGARALLDEQPYVSPAEAARVLGSPPFVVGKILAQARGFTMDDLKRTHELLYTYDVGLKSGKIDAGLATDLATLDLLRT